ncbi:MAG: hypothetical protein A2148_04780 [Chloroflexi bacterium RBG_16_68_14]|nr:MAG: hypothetical protein A2148_04780 [Chloroflexi bacterium RBG_16_68_14]
MAGKDVIKRVFGIFDGIGVWRVRDYHVQYVWLTTDLDATVYVTRIRLEREKILETHRVSLVASQVSANRWARALTKETRRYQGSQQS